MYQKAIFLVLAALLLSLFFSCASSVNTKEAYLENYEEFIEEIKENKNNYTQKDWEKKDIEFQKFSEELYEKYEGEMGIFEQARIAKYALVYGSTRGVNALKEALDDEEIESAIDEISNIFNDDIKEDLESAIEELKEVWDEDLKDELEDKLDEVKTRLEDEEFREELNESLEEVKEVLEDKEIQGKLKDALEELEEVFQEIEKKVDKN